MTIKKGDTHTAMLGGLARAQKLTPVERSAIARKARAQRTANYNATHATKTQTNVQHPTTG